MGWASRANPLREVKLAEQVALNRWARGIYDEMKGRLSAGQSPEAVQEWLSTLAADVDRREQSA